MLEVPVVDGNPGSTVCRLTLRHPLVYFMENVDDEITYWLKKAKHQSVYIAMTMECPYTLLVKGLDTP